MRDNFAQLGRIVRIPYNIFQLIGAMKIVNVGPTSTPGGVNPSLEPLPANQENGVLGGNAGDRNDRFALWLTRKKRNRKPTGVVLILSSIGLTAFSIFQILNRKDSAEELPLSTCKIVSADRTCHVPPDEKCTWDFTVLLAAESELGPVRASPLERPMRDFDESDSGCRTFKACGEIEVDCRYYVINREEPDIKVLLEPYSSRAQFPIFLRFVIAGIQFVVGICLLACPCAARPEENESARAPV